MGFEEDFRGAEMERGGNDISEHMSSEIETWLTAIGQKRELKSR